MPAVTVLFPVYNSQHYVRAAIDSILAQTWRDFELLIINDASTDASRSIITTYTDPRIRLVDNPTNLGLTRSLNQGLHLARGTFIARQDSDDLSHPTRIEQQVTFMQHHPEVPLLGSRARLIDEHGSIITNSFLSTFLTSAVGIRWQLMFENAFVHSAVMFRRDLVRDVFGGYDERFRQAQDYELWSRIARTHAIRNLPAPLVDLRKSSTSVSARNPQASNQFMLAVIQHNLKHFLQRDTIPAGWLDLIAAFLTARRTNRLHDVGLFLSLIERLYLRYSDLHPAARHDPDTRTYLADLLARAAYHGILLDRWASLVAYLHAWRYDRHVIWRIPLWKYAGLWLLGDAVRRAYHRNLPTRTRPATRQSEVRTRSYE